MRIEVDPDGVREGEGGLFEKRIRDVVRPSRSRTSEGFVHEVRVGLTPIEAQRISVDERAQAFVFRSGKNHGAKEHHEPIVLFIVRSEIPTRMLLDEAQNDSPDLGILARFVKADPFEDFQKLFGVLFIVEAREKGVEYERLLLALDEAAAVQFRKNIKAALV